jgi:hypothetical protein
MDMTSNLNRQYEIDNLVTKIDTLTSNFLDTTAVSRETMNRIATADTYNSNLGLGVSYGSWGNLGQGEIGIDTTATTIATASAGGALLGSVEQSQQQQPQPQQQQQHHVLGEIDWVRRAGTPR